MKKYIWVHKTTLFITVIFRCLESGLQVITSIALMETIDATVEGNMAKLTKWLIITAVIFLAYSICVLMSNLTLYKYIEKTLVLFKEHIFKGIIRKDYKRFKEQNTAEYISSLTNDINLVENNYLLPTIQRIGDYVILITSIVVLLFINLWVTLLTLLVSLIIFISPIFFQKKLSENQKKVSKKFSNFTDKIKDIFSGYEVIKTFRIEKIKKQEFDNENSTLESEKFNSNKILSFAGTTSAALSIFIQIVVVSFSAVLVIKGFISAGSLVAVLQLSGQIVVPFMNIVEKTNRINGMKEINKKLIDLANTKPEKATQKIKSFKNSLLISNLSYEYEEGKTIIDNLSFEFKKGKKYAIVGKSGSGKSTLLQLIMGYDNTYKGLIAIDGQDLKDVCNESRYSVFTIMHQNVYMFNEGILDNITFGKNYDKDLLAKKLNESGVSEVVSKISYATMSDIGENGNKLSGGQRQRVAIARALLNGSQILLLDEAMSSLDPKNAREIEGLILAQKDMTVISVTHKLSDDSLQKYDEILVMDDGQIIESGSFNELSNNVGLFNELCYNYSKEVEET